MVTCLALREEDLADINQEDELQQVVRGPPHPGGCYSACVRQLTPTPHPLHTSQWDNADESTITKKKIKSVLVFPELRQHGIATGGADPQVRGQRGEGGGHRSPTLCSLRPRRRPCLRRRRRREQGRPRRTTRRRRRCADCVAWRRFLPRWRW